MRNRDVSGPYYKEIEKGNDLLLLISSGADVGKYVWVIHSTPRASLLHLLALAKGAESLDQPHLHASCIIRSHALSGFPLDN